MRVLIDKSSNKKQYVEKDNLLLVEDSDIIKFDVVGGQRHFRFNSMFELMVNLLELKDPEAAIYWTLLYGEDTYTSYRQVCIACQKYFGRCERTYHKFFEDLTRRGIIKTDYQNRVYVSEEYDIKNFKANYIVLKVN